nr:hypothetical protein [Tanacetum cinerariifolium]
MPPKRTTTPITDAAIKALIAQGVATALAEYEANRGSGNGVIATILEVAEGQSVSLEKSNKNVVSLRMLSVKVKSKIKRYIDTKPNHELIHYCLKNPPYKFTWADKQVLISEGSHVTRTKTYMETYKNVSQDIRDQLNAEAEAVQIILTGIDNDIYSTVDACPNACEMWKAIERGNMWKSRIKRYINTKPNHKLIHYCLENPPYELGIDNDIYSKVDACLNACETWKEIEWLKQGESINVEDLETNLYWEFRKFTSQDGESLESYYSSRTNQDNSTRINRNDGYENQRIGNVAGARETVGSSVVQKSGIQCYNCKEFGHVARDCQKPKRAKDAAYHREKMLLYKQKEARI